MKSLPKFLFVFAGLTLLFAPFAHAQREKLPPDDLDYVRKTWPEAKKTNTCIRYIVERQGIGAPAKPGDKVSVLYTGRLLDGKIFDQMLDPQHPFQFRVRRGEVIDGWDQFLQLMNKGEKALVIIPGELAYGTRGQPPTIPRNATLVFEIELLDIVRE